MRIVRRDILLDIGQTAEMPSFKKALKDIEIAISSVVWADPKNFIINPTPKGNGVNPIKSSFIRSLLDSGWLKEARISITTEENPGPIDAVKETEAGTYAVEWETGNVSSSHRALNKMAIGILKGKLQGGILILPTRELGRYLTDRIGNYEELRPYFPLYKSLTVLSGILVVISVTYDSASRTVVLIPKGKDGNAKKT